jgi:hypothetical protein
MHWLRVIGVNSNLNSGWNHLLDRPIACRSARYSLGLAKVQLSQCGKYPTRCPVFGQKSSTGSRVCWGGHHPQWIPSHSGTSISFNPSRVTFFQFAEGVVIFQLHFVPNLNVHARHWLRVIGVNSAQQKLQTTSILHHCYRGGLLPHSYVDTEHVSFATPGSIWIRWGLHLLRGSYRALVLDPDWKWNHAVRLVYWTFQALSPKDLRREASQLVGLTRSQFRHVEHTHPLSSPARASKTRVW